MSVPAYAEYKDSGVAWLGAVPSHWDVTRLKQICKVFPSNVDKKSADGEQPVRLCNYTDVYYNEVISRALPFMEATASDEQIAKFTLRAGDTIITKDSETADDIARSAYVPEDMPGVVCGYHLSMVRPTARAHGSFIKRYFDTTCARAYFHVNANGLTRVGLGQYAVDNAPIALPPVEEQTAIAAFLDQETAKIDALVAEQERLIALLKEKRQAVISHTVTKGLNPNAPMKDSGIEWLGEIPAHWDVRRLRQLATLNPSKSEIGDWDAETEVSFLPMEAIGEHGALSLERTRPIAESQTGYTYFREGDVTIAKITPCFENGKGAIMKGLVQGVGFGTTELIVIRPSQDATTSEFLDWNFRSETFRALGEGSMYGAGGQKRVPDDFVRDFPICLPSLEEQRQIVGYLDRMTLRFDSLSAEAQSAIALLQERRATLISAAVTGKIDVRGLVATEQELELA